MLSQAVHAQLKYKRNAMGCETADSEMMATLRRRYVTR